MSDPKESQNDFRVRAVRKGISLTCLKEEILAIEAPSKSLKVVATIPKTNQKKNL